MVISPVLPNRIRKAKQKFKIKNLYQKLEKDCRKAIFFKFSFKNAKKGYCFFRIFCYNYSTAVLTNIRRAGVFLMILN